MKNLYLLVVIFALSFASCAGYFDSQSSGINDGEAVKILKLSGSDELLSLDDANEISPYLFTDTNGVKYLFFSSDRDGTYDIWFAKMDAAGEFYDLRKLSTNINTDISNEYCPVVFYNNDFGSISTEITYLQSSNDVDIKASQPGGGGVNIVSASFKGDFESMGKMINFTTNATHISLYQNTNTNILVFSTGTNSVGTNSYYYMNMWEVFNFNEDFFAEGLNIYAACAFTEEVPLNPFYFNSAFYYLMEVETGDNHSLYARYVINNLDGDQGLFPTISSNYLIAEYDSPHNDIHPFVDMEDYRVYFASDRYGDNGKYDLYRYNVMTITNIMEYYPPGDYLSTLPTTTTIPEPS